MKKKKPGQRVIQDSVAAAKERGLYVLVERGEQKLWDVKTGKWVLTYYPATRRWVALQDREGSAPTLRDAIAAVLGPCQSQAATGPAG